MSRSYAPIFTSIWQNPEFCALSSHAQRVYLLLLSQPNIAYTGVLSATPGRWARMAADTSTDVVADAIDELADGRFVMVDDDTEELWIRSFIRYNRVLEQPQLRKAMVRSFPAILSPALRRALFDAMPSETQEEMEKTCSPAIPPPCPQPDGHPAPTLPAASREGSLLSVTRCSVDRTPNTEHATHNTEPPSSSSSSDASSDDPAWNEEDEESRVEVTKARYAQRKARQQEAAGHRIGYRPNWLRATAAGADREVREHFSRFPDDDPMRAVEFLLPDPTPPPEATPGPLDGTARAQAERAERGNRQVAGEVCEECSDTGLVLDETDVARACACPAGKRVAV